ncbi:MAG: KamA family radical SAM protein [Bacillota bacterium]
MIKIIKKNNKLTKKDKKEIAQARAEELRKRIETYLEVLPTIEKGRELETQIKERQKLIMNKFKATRREWNNWHWQMKNRISSIKRLKDFIDLSDNEIKEIHRVEKRFRWSISPYFLSLVDPDNKNCPIRKQAIPSKLELIDAEGKLDPMQEELTNPAGSITRRYPDRLIIKMTNICAMFCRHCQRRRAIGQEDHHFSEEIIDESIEYIKVNPEIRDVLITGGDPLTMGNKQLENYLKKLRDIDHVEIIRIGSRTPISLPQRITQDLCEMLAKYHPLYINIQVNHPKEMTQEVFSAADKLNKAGIPLGNQAVLLKDINDDPHVMKALNHELLKARIKPYYIFHAKKVTGTSHFQTSVDAGIEIMENLRGFTSGMAIPQFIVNAPGGLGKTPVTPEYIISRGKDFIKLRTWEGKIIDYQKNS